MKGRVVKVLVLGGDPDAGEELMHIIGDEGFQVEVAASLEAGLHLVRTHQFGIVVLDLAMFRGNEAVLLRQIQEKGNDLAVLAIGELPGRHPDIAPLLARLAGYLEKPLGRDKLIASLRAVARDRGLHRNHRNGLLASIGARIRTERKRQSLTLKQVAERTSLSVSLLSQIERAESAASVSSLFKIASALNLPLQSFFEGY